MFTATTATMNVVIIIIIIATLTFLCPVTLIFKSPAMFLPFKGFSKPIKFYLWGSFLSLFQIWHHNNNQAESFRG